MSTFWNTNFLPTIYCFFIGQNKKIMLRTIKRNTVKRFLFIYSIHTFVNSFILISHPLYPNTKLSKSI